MQIKPVLGKEWQMPDFTGRRKCLQDPSLGRETFSSHIGQTLCYSQPVVHPFPQWMYVHKSLWTVDNWNLVTWHPAADPTKTAPVPHPLSTTGEYLLKPSATLRTEPWDEILPAINLEFSVSTEVVLWKYCVSKILTLQALSSVVWRDTYKLRSPEGSPPTAGEAAWTVAAQGNMTSHTHWDELSWLRWTE